MSIKRDVNGIVDYCIGMVETIDARDDLDVEKKAKIGLAYLKEAREFVKANLAYKNLMMRAPDVARNAGIVLPIGSPQINGLPSQVNEPQAAASA